MTDSPRTGAQADLGPLLDVTRLQVAFGGSTALHDISLHVDAGETLGLVGESGSGKSTLARAILRLVPATGGEVWWRGEDLLKCSSRELRPKRRELQIVFQDPMASLNPRLTVGAALAEPLAIFEPAVSARARKSAVAQMLERVGLSAEMARRYPHEFSGGQCQRIGIARAMMLRPALLICDEPVSSLDVSIQGQIINLLMDLQKEHGTAMLFISHDLAVVRHVSHRVMVMYRGRAVEVAMRDALFAIPAHPYTRALLAAVPDPTRAFAATAPVTGVESTPPTSRGKGCAFHDRCPHGQPACLDTLPVLQSVASRHEVACHRWRELVYS